MIQNVKWKIVNLGEHHQGKCEICQIRRGYCELDDRVNSDRNNFYGPEIERSLYERDVDFMLTQIDKATTDTRGK